MKVEDFRRTKIIATIGPSSSKPELIRRLIHEGVNVFRLNFSHGSHQDHLENITNIRSIASNEKRPVAILGDLQGPKIRISKISNDSIYIEEGDELIVTIDDVVGDTKIVSTTYQQLPNDVNVSDKILIDDGLLELEVLKKDASNVYTKVVVGGELKSNKGINLPNVHISTPAITKKDKIDLAFAIENDIDFIALSFVRSASDVIALKAIMSESHTSIPIISKIEKPEALEVINEIIEESYGIMVARGDLGVELNPEEVPTVQKMLIKKCNKAGKPVITATQMLDSMIRNPRPTRAEASDVANAVLDGTDAVMLSGETASGSYPVESVQMMHNIIHNVENKFIDKLGHKRLFGPKDFSTVSQAVAYSAVNIARNLNAKLIACVTHSGNTATEIAKYKSNQPVLAITDELLVPRKMALTWGVISIIIEKIEKTEECFNKIEDLLEDSGFLEEGDLVIFTAGMPTMERNSTNMIKVHKIAKGSSNLL